MKFNYTHDHRLLVRNARAKKAIKAFYNFWITIQFEYKFCFVCGNMIPKLFNNTALQPFGSKKDWVHKQCFDRFITFGDAKTRLDENSRLICHIHHAFDTSPSNVCRERVENNKDAMNIHIKEEHQSILEFHYSFELMRKLYFLKPNGRNFTR